VESSNYWVYAPENAIGKQDEAYLEFREQNGSVTLDMGEGEDGSGDLTMEYVILQYGASYKVEFLDASMNVLQTAAATFEMYSTETSIAYGGDPYRYVRMSSTQDQLWKLDSVAASTFVETEPPVTNDQEPKAGSETAADEQESDVPPQGLLVKLVDDGDPMTTADSAIYIIGADGKRHAFPSELVYRSWFEDYDNVAFIDPENLAGYQLGANVTVRPGTWLVKIATDPKVYAVEPGGVLRWITTEKIASELYGHEWNDRVIDVPDTLWKNYSVGEALVSEVAPAGTLGVLPSGELTYLDHPSYYSIPGTILDYMRFNGEYSVTIDEDHAVSFIDAGDLSEDPAIAYPF